jgi:hypothetical protein
MFARDRVRATIDNRFASDVLQHLSEFGQPVVGPAEHGANRIRLSRMVRAFGDGQQFEHIFWNVSTWLLYSGRRRNEAAVQVILQL